MAARPDSVCKFICEAGDWRVSNLQLQKLLYVGQMCYLGMTGERLADVSFEAWEYGPVAPSVYRQVRMFGAGPVRDVFDQALPFKEDSLRLEVLKDVCRDLLPLRAGDLVEITHWENGAWAKYYTPGCRGVRIPDSALIAEYQKRVEEGYITPNQPDS